MAPVLAFSLSATAEQTPAETAVYRELCSGGLAEGTYAVTFHAKSKFRITIVCTSPVSLVAGLRSLEASDVSYSLNHTTLDRDTISFVTFKTSREDAESLSSRNLDGRLKLDVGELKKGRLKGQYMALNIRDPVSIAGQRETGFPDFLSQARGPMRSISFPAYFDVTHAKVSATVILDIIGGLQRINVHIDGANSYVLYNGLAAAESGDVFYATSGVDDSSGGRVNLQHVRGRFISDDEIEFFYLDTIRGMMGPYRAIRRPLGP